MGARSRRPQPRSKVKRSLPPGSPEGVRAAMILRRSPVGLSGFARIRIGKATLRRMTDFDYAAWWRGPAHRRPSGSPDAESALIAGSPAVADRRHRTRAGLALPLLRSSPAVPPSGFWYTFEPDGRAIDRLASSCHMRSGSTAGESAPRRSRRVSPVGEWAEDSGSRNRQIRKAFGNPPHFTALTTDYLALDLRSDEADSPVVYFEPRRRERRHR
jgi:hypothetical protein